MTHAHVITGSFGAGKTTAIRWLMSHKPAGELWVVILNEFTDAGIDALAVAESARGSYDVRMIAGGCLCCVGELEFGKQLRDILRTLQPSRLLIEPSGAGHAADIVDELTLYERQQALKLDSIVCLVDPSDARHLSLSRDVGPWSQIQSADVLLLSKADTATDDDRAAFAAIAAEQFPAKQYVGSCRGGELPPQALARYTRAPALSLLRHDTASPPTVREFTLAKHPAYETQTAQLGLWGVAWTLPEELTFARSFIEPRVTWLLDAYPGHLRRLKGVFRTGPGPSWLVHSTGRGLSGEDTAYRRDSRLEIVLNASPSAGYLDAWRSVLHDAAN